MKKTAIEHGDRWEVTLVISGERRTFCAYGSQANAAKTIGRFVGLGKLVGAVDEVELSWLRRVAL